MSVGTRKCRALPGANFVHVEGTKLYAQTLNHNLQDFKAHTRKAECANHNSLQLLENRWILVQKSFGTRVWLDSLKSVHIKT